VTNLSSDRALAIETSGRQGSVALAAGSNILTDASFAHGLKHAAGLLPLIDQLMREQQWTPSSLKYLYVSHGPGSFTGLRIAITLAKTIAFATGAKIVPVPTLRVLANNAPDEARNVVIVLDAKRDQIFTARYEWVSDQWIEREPAHLDRLAAMLSRSPRPVHLLGEGIPFHEQFVPADRAGIILTSESTWVARASVVAQIGIKLADEGRFVEPSAFVPLYVRIPEAQEKYELQHGPAGTNI
jgi:tRNA threonylcarbamoyladenosine biosynthesis protein TsaB